MINSTDNNLLASALEYARQGYKVHPLVPNQKNPLLTGWPEVASCDEQTIRRWWEENPNANVGVLADNLVVVDVDKKNGKDGEASLREYGYEDDGKTFRVNTPSGGHHLYFKQVDAAPISNRTNVLSGVDIRSQGGYVVGAGSVIDGKSYDWVERSAPVLPVPVEILKLLETNRGEGSSVVETVPASARSLGAQTDLIALDLILGEIAPNLPYNAWRNVVFASLNEFGKNDDVIGCLRVWSEAGESYDAVDFDKLVGSYDDGHPSKLTAGTLASIAADYPLLPIPARHPNCSDGAAVALLLQKTFEKAIISLEDFGNTLTSAHDAGIKNICEGLVRGVYTDEPFRNAFPLPVGMGKTTCVKALIWSMYELGLHTERSLLIAAERIEQLHELRQDLVSMGVPDGLVGIFHKSDKYPKVISVSIDDLDTIPFLCIAHQRIQNQLSDHSTSLTYRGKPRDLVIWDESLISTNGEAVSAESLSKDIAAWQAGYGARVSDGRVSRNPEDFEKFDSWLTKLADAVKNSKDSEIIVLPSCPLGLTVAKRRLNTIHHSRVLEKIIDGGFQTTRKVRTENGSAYVRFFITVPNVINKIVILDASAEIRKLQMLDKTISLFPLGVEKDYSDVVIHHNSVGASKYFLNDDAKLKLYLDELTYWLREVLPRGEDCIVLCMKAYTDNINRCITDAGTGYKDRVHVVTWGSHKATNKYCDVEYVFTVGVLYRDVQELAASIVGQRRELTYPVTNKEISSIRDSEQAELIYQGLARGACRKTINGQAGKMHIYLNHDKPGVLELLKRVMPKVQICTYKAKHLKPETRTNSVGDHIDLSEKIGEFLESTKVDKVFFGSVKKKLGITSTNKRLWDKAKKHYLNEQIEWSTEGNNFVRACEM